MLLLHFYRFYTAAGAGIGAGIWRGPWAGLTTFVGVRATWWIVERQLAGRRVERLYSRHISPFKQLCGPYGIRLANKAEQEGRIKRSLAEVFEPNLTKLQRTMQTLEAMNALFTAGMRPEAEEFLLHDLKLKYGRYRLDREQK
jgi:hypothetical protein